MWKPNCARSSRATRPSTIQANASVIGRRVCCGMKRPRQHLLPTKAMLSAPELKSLNERFNTQPTEEILRWASERFGLRAGIGTSFQGAGLVMMYLAKQHGLNFPVFTLDTGLLFPETIQLQKR